MENRLRHAIGPLQTTILLHKYPILNQSRFVVQVKDFWQTVGREMRSRLINEKEKNVWMSTCGGAVSWLHMRLDSTPKYYSFMPYKSNV